MKKIYIFVLLCVFAMPFTAEAKRPQSMAELFRLLGVNEVVFGSCGALDLDRKKGVDALTRVKRNCWAQGKEGGKTASTDSTTALYRKNGTGEVEARGEVVSFKWHEKQGAVYAKFDSWAANSVLRGGIYLDDLDNPMHAMPYMLKSPDVRKALRKMR